MKAILTFASLLLFFSSGLQSQELFCNVNVNYNQVGQSDKQVFQDMQRDINEYINFTQWTEDKFQNHEKIRCQIRIIINSRPSPDYFKATANITISRPVFNSSFESILANLSDKQFSFHYVAGQPLQFNESGYTDDLTALLNYYAFIILGFDYGSYSPNGGKPYFQKAQDWVQFSQASSEAGWTSSGLSQTNRYWLAENLSNSRYRAFHNMLYKYHRKGLDQMTENLPRARKAILESIRDMQKLSSSNPLLGINRVFLNAKTNELIKIFDGAFVQDQKVFVEIMGNIDPKNLPKYQKVLK